MNTPILRHDRETLGAEHCTLTALESGFQFSGTVLCPVEGTPNAVSERLVCKGTRLAAATKPS